MKVFSLYSPLQKLYLLSNNSIPSKTQVFFFTTTTTTTTTTTNTINTTTNITTKLPPPEVVSATAYFRDKPKLNRNRKKFSPKSQIDGIAGEIGNSKFVAKLPRPNFTRIMSAEFIKSSTSVEDCPPETLPEFAVIGRSNVGKSSLINSITGRKTLAATSKTPGKTKHINHFLINNSWYLVDLPGYGYAKIGEEKRLEWGKFIENYFLNRNTLANVLLLVDASIPPMPIDITCANWLGDAKIPFTVVFTKTDRKKKGVPKCANNIFDFQKSLSETWDELPACFGTSARTNAGRTELVRYISSLREFYMSSNKDNFIKLKI